MQMGDNEQLTAAKNASQKAEIVTMLQQILTEFDDLGLAVPAIKIAEAIDSLE